MKTSLFSPLTQSLRSRAGALITVVLGFALAAACGPSKPANNPDDGSSPSGTGGSTETGGTSTGGTTESGGATASGGSAGSGGSTGTGGAGAGGSAGAQTPAQMVASGDAANGEKLFAQEHCDGCHGTNKKPPANAKFPALFKIKWDDHEFEEAFGMIKKGKGTMPSFNDKLQDKQIADILAYLKANSK